MPSMKDGALVYDDAELAQAQQANASTAVAREKQARLDSLMAQSASMTKLAQHGNRLAEGAARAAEMAEAEAAQIRGGT